MLFLRHHCHRKIREKNDTTQSAENFAVPVIYRRLQFVNKIYIFSIPIDLSQVVTLYCAG